MIDVVIPGFGRLTLTDLICDFNGTLARDGRLLRAARALLPKVARVVNIRVVTGDTFGSAREALRQCPCEVVLLGPRNQARAKTATVEQIGAARVVAVGNGRNDRLMLKAAALGIAVIGDEGVAAEAVRDCDVVARDIAVAFELLLSPRRLVATLRD
jgi:soluble P-type ATPase